MKKVIIAIAMLVAFVAIQGEAESLMTQILWSVSWLVILAVAGKLAEKYCLTDEEKEERV